SVSFANIPDESPIDSSAERDATISPMPERDEDLGLGLSQPEGDDEVRELAPAFNEAWDESWDSTAPAPSESSVDVMGPPEAPVEDTEFSFTPKSKKKKKKGKNQEEPPHATEPQDFDAPAFGEEFATEPVFEQGAE